MMTTISDKHTVYAGEARLMNWADTSSRGRTVTFELPPDSDTHPFRDLAIRQGKKAGQRFMLAVVQIDDQEEPVEQQKRLSQQAAILCKDETFWQFAAERSISKIDSEASCRAWMLSGAGITSRKEFDTNNRAADWFISQCKLPFEAFMATIEQGAI
jgi:hypothetical protein